ncbi:Arm DNA-binding domain-containing protein [Salmonella enterica subsp. enterica]|uniref:Arm DNA-binding domain-containing protein n=1 Tax=Salmonella enterica TaxID=28901 RepID=UPI0033155898
MPVVNLTNFLSAGLFLLVNPTGSTCWRRKYRIEGKEKSPTSGTWPDVAINEAIKPGCVP